MFRALEQLYALGALNDKGELTTMGEATNRSVSSFCLMSILISRCTVALQTKNAI